jgi:hypothetical protein
MPSDISREDISDLYFERNVTRVGKKRAFEFDLSQSMDGVDSILPPSSQETHLIVSKPAQEFGFDPSQSIKVVDPIMPRSQQHDNRIISRPLLQDRFPPKSLLRSSILDCIEGISDLSARRPAQIMDVSGHPYGFDCPSTSRLDESVQPQRWKQRTFELRERSADGMLQRDVSPEKNLFQVTARRPALPGPASSGFDLDNAGPEKNSQAVQRIELPARVCHRYISPIDPDFSKVSWLKMLQDLDLEPYSGVFAKTMSKFAC